jgi:hypothetical protein
VFFEEAPHRAFVQRKVVAQGKDMIAPERHQA